jgi:hypothetical protein
MRELVDRAHEEGVTRLLAYVSAYNRPVHGWMARVGGVAEANDGDATLCSISLDRFAEERRAA